MKLLTQQRRPELKKLDKLRDEKYAISPCWLCRVTGSRVVPGHHLVFAALSVQVYRVDEAARGQTVRTCHGLLYCRTRWQCLTFPCLLFFVSLLQTRVGQKHSSANTCSNPGTGTGAGPLFGSRLCTEQSLRNNIRHGP
jgi:hypothetical protein